MSITHKQKPILEIDSSFVINRYGIFKSGNLKQTFSKSLTGLRLYLRLEKWLVARKLKTIAVKLILGWI